MENDAHRPTAVTESGVAIGAISAITDLPVAKIRAKEQDKNLRGHLLRHCKPVSVLRIARFVPKSDLCP